MSKIHTKSIVWVYFKKSQKWKWNIFNEVFCHSGTPYRPCFWAESDLFCLNLIELLIFIRNTCRVDDSLKLLQWYENKNENTTKNGFWAFNQRPRSKVHVNLGLQSFIIVKKHGPFHHQINVSALESFFLHHVGPWRKSVTIVHSDTGAVGHRCRLKSVYVTKVNLTKYLIHFFFFQLLPSGVPTVNHLPPSPSPSALTSTVFISSFTHLLWGRLYMVGYSVLVPLTFFPFWSRANFHLARISSNCSVLLPQTTMSSENIIVYGASHLTSPAPLQRTHQSAYCITSFL